MKLIITFALTLGVIWWFNGASANTAALKGCHSIESCQAVVDVKAMRLNLNNAPKYAYNSYRSRNYRYRNGRYYRVKKVRNYKYRRSNVRHVFPKQVSASGVRTFVFSPRYKMWAAYDRSGKRVAHGIANGGASYCADVGRPCRTPSGTFRVHSKGSYDCKSSKYPVGRGGAPMPYCMFFRGGYAIHGSPQISNRNGSHGCIRVTTSAARWLSSRFMTIGTRVRVLPY